MSTVRVSWRDGVAAVIVAALWVVYAELLVRGSVGFIIDPRAMGSIGLISSVLLCPLGNSSQASGVWLWVVSALGAVATALGIVTVVTVSWAALAAFMIAIAAMWALTTLHHLLGTARRSPSRAGTVTV
jgi:hypothetical protein